jgi:hypothetical protein
MSSSWIASTQHNPCAITRSAYLRILTLLLIIYANEDLSFVSNSDSLGSTDRQINSEKHVTISNGNASDNMANSDSALDDYEKRQSPSTSYVIAGKFVDTVSQQSSLQCEQMHWLTTGHYATGKFMMTGAVKTGGICMVNYCQNEIDSLNLSGLAKLMNPGRMNEIVLEQLRRIVAEEVESLLTLKACTFHLQVSDSLPMIKLNETCLLVCNVDHQGMRTTAEKSLSQIPLMLQFISAILVKFFLLCCLALVCCLVTCSGICMESRLWFKFMF